MSLKEEPIYETLTFEDGDWIKVRTNRQYGDTVAAQRAAAKEIKTEKPEKGKRERAVTSSFDISAFNLSLLKSQIIEWSDDEEINANTIMALPNHIIAKCLVAITDNRDDEEEEDLEPTSPSPSALDGDTTSQEKERASTGPAS